MSTSKDIQEIHSHMQAIAEVRDRLHYTVSRPIAPVDVNSVAGVVNLIRKDERIHFLLGIKTAEGFIRLGIQSLNQLQNTFSELEKKNCFRSIVSDQVSDIPQDTSGAEVNEFLRYGPLVRDTIAQVTAAEAELNRIKEEHPELEFMSYDEIQGSFGVDAAIAKQAAFIAGRAIAQQYQLPDAVGEMLVGMSQDQVMKVLAKARQMINPVEESLSLDSALEILSALHPGDREKQRQALIASGHHIRQVWQATLQSGKSVEPAKVSLVEEMINVSGMEG